MCENELAIKRPRFDLSYCDLLIFLPSFFFRSVVAYGIEIGL